MISLRFPVLAIVALASVPLAYSAEIAVSSVAELQSVLDSAQTGDVVILANGTYTDNRITVTASNITVRAETPGGVFLNGTNSIKIPGSNVVFSGFQFTSGSIPGFVIEVSGSNNTLTQLNFNGYSAQKYIALTAGSQYNAITYSNFQNKPATAPQGNLIHVGPDASVPGYHTISHNSCQHLPGRGGDNGNECIRLGNGAQSAYIARTVVEYNYFEDTGPGDSEAISVKSRENTLRWNTMNKNPDAMFVFRNGDYNLAYGNFFIDSGGIRVKQANTIYCFNNYFERSGVGGTMNAVTYDYVGADLENINFFHNTFVDSGLIRLSLGASNNTWANNLFKSSSGDIFSGSPSGISWVGNMYSGSLGITIPSGMIPETEASLGLTLNSDGYYGLSASSAAIDQGSSFPPIYAISGIDGDYDISLDTAGQFRDALKDVGSDEYGATGTITNRPLTLADVGPFYLGGPYVGTAMPAYGSGATARTSSRHR